MTDHNDDFVSFDKALRELNIQSDELKRLVSEGEIRAFRDGDSMKFKREDLETMSPDQNELVFADNLEDDTGMVTEELSDEDTLLADDDLLDDEPAQAPATPARSRSAAPSRRRAEAEVEESEPVWGALAAALAFILMLWASMAVWSLKNEVKPSGLLGVFAKAE